MTLIARITPSVLGASPPTGEVTFTDGNVWLGAAAPAIRNGKPFAELQTTGLLVGGNPIVATYTGDDNYAGSTSGSTSVTGTSDTAPSAVTVHSAGSVAAGPTYTATTTTTGTGGIVYSPAATPAAPSGMTIDPSSGTVTFKVPSSGLSSFSYAVVASNAAGRAESAVVTVAVPS